jgi:aryl-alcohol dehydrogenase-like predicted oxidoreductase
MSYGGGNSGFHQWSLGEEESRPFIKKALEAGINFFDTANRYSVGKSEEVLGRALSDFARREEVVIATKVFINQSISRFIFFLTRRIGHDSHSA